MIDQFAHFQRQVSNQRDTEDFDVAVNPESSSRFLHPSFMTNFLFRSKRDGEVEKETIPTRHAKRRKRRRCRNRTTCLRGIFAVQKANETKEDRDVNNTVLESGEEQRERSGTIARAQVIIRNVPVTQIAKENECNQNSIFSAT